MRTGAAARSCDRAGAEVNQATRGGYSASTTRLRYSVPGSEPL